MEKGSGGWKDPCRRKEKAQSVSKTFPDFSQYPEEKEIETKKREIVFRALRCYKTEVPPCCTRAGF